MIYRAAVRVESDGTQDSAMLWFRVDLPDCRMGFFVNMQDRPIRSREWKVYEIAGDIAPEAVKVNFGIMTHGKARVWIDDASLETVERKDQGPEVTAAREAIQKQYARMDQATAAGRWDEVLAMALPDAPAGNAALKRPISQQVAPALRQRHVRNRLCNSYRHGPRSGFEWNQIRIRHA